MIPRASRSLALAPLALAALAGCSSPPPPPSTPRAVRVVTLSPRELSSKSRHAGSLEPWERIELSFGVPGKVLSLAEVDEGGRRRPIQEGDPVRRGQLLATLDDGDFRSQARAAAAGVQSADAQEQAAANALAQARSEVERARSLFASATIAKAELDRAEAAFAAAGSSLAAAKGQRLGRSEQLALARSTVEDARLVSPIDGVLARRLVDVGESVSPALAAFTVIDTFRLRVLFGVSGPQVGAMTIGRKLPVRIEGLPGEALVGTISKVLPVADPQLRSFSVEVVIPNSENLLRAGMVGSVAVGGEPGAAVSLVPLEAIVRAPGTDGFATWVVPPGNAVTLRPVEVGDLHGNEVIVTTGLAAGERVVTQGAQLLREGELVEVIP